MKKILLTCDGNLNQAKKIINSSEDDFLFVFKNWMRNCYTNDFSKIQSDLDWFNGQSRVNKKAFFLYSLNLFRESFIQNINSDLSKIVDDELEFIEKFSNSLNQNILEKIILEINESIRFLDRNANPKIIFLDLSLELVNMFNQVKQIA